VAAGPRSRRSLPTRRYRPETLILDNEWETADGRVRVIDFMPPRDKAVDIVRIVEGLRWSVRMRRELALPFDYGQVIPWVRRDKQGIRAVAGPDAVYLATPASVRGEHLRTISDFTVQAGQRVSFVLTWTPSHHPRPRAVNPEKALRDTGTS
jgi:hypothetical protein